MDFSTLKQLSKVYPILVKPFDLFDATTVTDQDIQTKIDSVIQYMNSLGQSNNDTVRSWNKVMQWVMDEGLTDSVNAKIDDMMANGTFNDLLTSLTNSLLGSEVLTTTNQDVKGAINEVKGIADANTLALGSEVLATTNKDVKGAINEVKGIADSNTSALAEKANQSDFKADIETNGKNIIIGESTNAISKGVYGAVICGGGTPGFNNVIGGSTANVGTSTPNVVDDTITAPIVAVIGGGYDNVNNALAGVITGMHCKIESAATHSTISGGSYHAINSGNYHTVGGGTKNTVTTTKDGATIGGGYTNIISGGEYVVIAGGNTNTASGDDSALVGGKQNTVTSLGGFLGGGQSNTVSQTYGTIGGGYTNNLVATGSYGTIAGGRGHTINNNYATVTGGYGNVANADYSQVEGYQAQTNIAGQRAFANGQFATSGDAQFSDMVLKKKTTDATAGYLFTTANSSPTLRANSAVLYKARIVAHRTDVQGDAMAFEVQGLATRASGSVTLVGSPSVTTIASTGVTWTVSVVTGSSTLNFNVTGEIGKTIQWLAKVEFVETVG